jgi:hypothetical protein
VVKCKLLYPLSMLPIHKTGKSNNVNYFLRKTKSFNKSRYSRNRQYYRTGVYLCLWANIIVVLGAYYAYYQLTFRFSYIPYIALYTVNLALFSYFSRNYFYGVVRTTYRMFNNLSVNCLIIFIKVQVLFNQIFLNNLYTFLLKKYSYYRQLYR